ncbi:ShlB/FhaC/HecB family hemolysin secretion/activation protein [Halodesulfovibrio aestuarii]|uniref:Hemolysin activation/secretion protein n=1 Tax=Halodesulfovibrio aestuarii TaxID=126333 RepID=A0A8G2CBL3_9BACT|nr:ShlB/FhaC/HecB family hemolysin secretion/activation protein [Halodesulfovibrio aestuarii]SHJ59896.1 Hemolysin activation/secretion protein [Halodesulfovibrio aestuarii]
MHKLATALLLLCNVSLLLMGQPLDGYSSTEESIFRNDAVLQQQEEQRRKELQKKHKEQYEKSLGDEEYLLPKSPEEADQKICVSIKTISLTGCTLLDEDEYSEIIARYSSKCLRLADIKELIRELTNLYIAKGYITSRIFVPQQDMGSGVLKLVVVEGEVTSFKFNPPAENGERQLYCAFPDLNGRKLNIRDIEQGLDQLNKLPSNNAKIRLEPGEKVGTTCVVIDNQPTRTWRPAFGVDNSGQELTGTTQFLSSFEKDNLFDLNDLLSISFSGDAENLFNYEGLRSYSLQSFYTMGYGYWSFSGTFGVFKYNSLIGDGNMQLRNTGETLTGGASLERVVYRSANSKFTLGTSFLSRCIRTYLDDTKLLASSYQLTDLSMYGSGVVRVLGTAISIRGEYTKGLPIFGVQPTDSEFSLASPQTTFDKATLNLSVMRPFTIYSNQFVFSSIFSTQWSPDTLYSAEQFSIGSRYTVRGFHEDNIYGSTGGYVRNDLALIIPMEDMWGLAKSIEIFAGYDAGCVLEDQHDAYNGGTLQGAVLGIRTGGGRLAAEIVFAKPLDAPDYLLKNDFEIYSSVKLTF